MLESFGKESQDQSEVGARRISLAKDPQILDSCGVSLWAIGLSAATCVPEEEVDFSNSEIMFSKQTRQAI
jgi:hypothetical protein